MPRLRRRAEARDIHQGGEAWALAPAERNEPFGNESTIEPLERHHVGDGAERNQVEEAQEVRLAPLQRPEAAPAQLAVERYQRHEDEADGGQVSQGWRDHRACWD